MTQAYRCEFTAAYVAVACLLVQPLLACSEQDTPSKRPAKRLEESVQVPIKIVTHQRHIGVDREYLRAMQNTCKFGVPGAQSVEFPKILTEVYYKNHEGVITEQYFQGKYSARYDKHTMFNLNATTCEIKEEVVYTANVDVDCEVSWHGRSGGDVATDDSVRQNDRCVNPLPKFDPKKDLLGFKEVLVKDGIPCLLPPQSESDAIKSCWYGRTPYYNDDKDRAVIFQVGSTGGVSVELVSLTDGTQAIPPDVFSIEGVRTWVSQPTVRVLK